MQEQDVAPLECAVLKDMLVIKCVVQTGYPDDEGCVVFIGVDDHSKKTARRPYEV